jgi:glycosyltransferase involved in cell wall biosynthesis
LHPYIQNRRTEIDLGIYPKHHLWGCDAIESNRRWTTQPINTFKLFIPKILEKIINRQFFRESPGIHVELSTWKASVHYDLIYSVCGPLSLARFYNRPKFVSWVFRMPTRSNDHFSPYNEENLKSHIGFCCLTPKAKLQFSEHALSEFLPWCVDLKLFDGNALEAPPAKPFFLASGKTGRDYVTLVKAAYTLEADIRIIGPVDQRPSILPKNIRWINTSTDPPDKAVNYNTLRKWYAQCVGVCIPLSGDADDTCGYTNMLEAMAMAKPVLMTRSGSLHINPEQRGFGKLVNPKDSGDWRSAMISILNNSEDYIKKGKEGRRIAQNEFSIKNFNKQLIKFLERLIEAH